MSPSKQENPPLVTSLQHVKLAIWIDRNNLTFNNKKPSLPNTLRQASNLIIKPINPPTVHLSNFPLISNSTLYLTTDASYEQSVTELGFALWTQSGVCVCACFDRANVEEAETRAVRLGLEVARDFGAKDVTVLTGCQNLAHTLQRGDILSLSMRASTVAHDIMHLSSSLDSCNFHFISKGFNVVAHVLAQQGIDSIEVIAGMDVLFTCKIGNLSVDINLVEVFAARVCCVENHYDVDVAMIGMLVEPKDAKRNALTYIETDGSWLWVGKSAAEKILDLCDCREDVRNRVHSDDEKFAEGGLWFLVVALQDILERTKDSPGGVWKFVALLPRFDPPRYDSVETIRRALDLGVNPKMITGDQFAIVKEIGRRLGMGTNTYPSFSLLDQDKDAYIAKDAARGAPDIVLTESGLSVIISAVLTSRAIFQRTKNYTVYAGNIIILKDRVMPSPMPDSWKLNDIFATGVVLRSYFALMTVFFSWTMKDTVSFLDRFGVRAIKDTEHDVMVSLYQQATIVSKALLFVTSSRSWSFVERPGMHLMDTFLSVQLIATLIAVYPNWGFDKIKGCGWGYGWAGKAWDNMLQNEIAFTNKKDCGKEERQADQWSLAERTLHDLLQPPETNNLVPEKSSYMGFFEIAEKTKRRVEMATLRELYTLKEHVESVAKSKGIYIDTTV